MLDDTKEEVIILETSYSCSQELIRDELATGIVATAQFEGTPSPGPDDTATSAPLVGPGGRGAAASPLAASTGARVRRHGCCAPLLASSSACCRDRDVGRAR